MRVQNLAIFPGKVSSKCCRVCPNLAQTLRRVNCEFCGWISLASKMLLCESFAKTTRENWVAPIGPRVVSVILLQREGS